MSKVYVVLFAFMISFGLLGCDTITVESPMQPVEGIQVTGTGSALGAPDVAVLDVGVAVERKSVQEARDEAAAAMQRVVTALKAAGVADEDLQTRQFSVQPQYNYINGRQELRGYLVTNTLTAKIRDVKQAGAIIDDAVEAAGDLVRIQSIRFTIDDPSALEAEARIKAMQDAHAKAQAIADEAGVTLGKPVSISEATVNPTPTPPYDRALGPEAETPIEPGQLEIRITVNVVYEIE